MFMKEEKNMKKKIIVALMAMTMSFSAVACTAANTGDATTQGASGESGRRPLPGEGQPGERDERRFLFHRSDECLHFAGRYYR